MNREQIVAAVLASLDGQVDRLGEQWNNPTGTRTRHLVLDDFLPAGLAQRVYAAFPRTGTGFYNRATFREKKKTSADLAAYDPLLGEITYALQDRRVVQRFAAIAGITRLEPDPLLYAGGLSIMAKGDFLNPHIDNSHDVDRGRYRRLNLLYYVSPDWTLENGGNFELWDEDRTVPKTIVSRQNRLVVMETNRTSWHSVSPVLVDRPRCCVSNYYFSPDSPDGSEYFHVTSFTGRPGERLKRAVSRFDNTLRLAVARVLGRGRGQDRINKNQ
jgi:Rps23 Pro-64 3,4-dihydroxylase Tpa1-like proline 4-hydroxylase